MAFTGWADLQPRPNTKVLNSQVLDPTAARLFMRKMAVGVLVGWKLS